MVHSVVVPSNTERMWPIFCFLILALLSIDASRLWYPPPRSLCARRQGAPHRRAQISRGRHRRHAIRAGPNSLSRRARPRDRELLTNKFVENAKWPLALDVSDPGDIEGLPSRMQDLFVQSEEPGLEGLWTLILDDLEILKYASSREVREYVYTSFSRRNSEGTYDNRDIIYGILQIRNDRAKRKGFRNFAELMATQQMLKSVAGIDEFLSNLSYGLQPMVQQELDLISEFASKNGQSSKLEPWDLDYWEERYKSEVVGCNEEEILPYLSLPSVLKSLFQLASILFGVRIESREVNKGTMIDDQAFDVADSVTGEHLGAFFLHPYAKDESAEAVPSQRRKRDKNVKPILQINLNLDKPSDGLPTLMSLEDVETLFHEFGHVTAALFTKRYELFTARERDSLEIVSTFMECWAYHKPTFESYAVHHKTGENLPRHVYHKVLQGKKLGFARDCLWQVAKAALDIELHARYDAESSEETLQDVERRIVSDITAEQHSDGDFWLGLFDHIFEFDDYASNYYAYAWALVVAFDAYDAFNEVGFENTSALSSMGRRFRETVLGENSKRSFLSVYHDFRGRQPSIESLLNHSKMHQK